MTKKDILDKLKGNLIVSCQVYPDDPMYTPDMALEFAKAADWGGCAGFRANSPEQIAMIKEAFPDKPIIGIWKKWIDGVDVYITPSIEDAKAIWDAGAQIIAMDGTFHTREDGRPAWQMIEEVKREIPEAIIFADIATIEEARNAVAHGADIVAPTLQGYTRETEGQAGPDFSLLKELKEELGDKAWVIMEGHINTPDLAMEALENGADAVVVGSAITRPHFVTKWFADAMKEAKKK